jgi:hypothetical protein
MVSEKDDDSNRNAPAVGALTCDAVGEGFKASKLLTVRWGLLSARNAAYQHCIETQVGATPLFHPAEWHAG